MTDTSNLSRRAEPRSASAPISAATASPPIQARDVLASLTRLQSGLVMSVIVTSAFIFVPPPAKATTAISGCDNQSLATVLVVNREHTADSAYVSPRTYAKNCYMWISQHKDKPVSVQTGRGNCIIWDSNYKLMGQWDDGSAEFKINDASDGKDYRLIIESTGNIRFEQCKGTGQGKCDE
ncbi:hypothetical protein [Roseiarcus fermentans]|uniref:hypothetical protein n=1 Tax=Roseiarcus fermentans TaxID=1473586 RepID=UPI001AECE217|nr:hypothetical protein [Roseiarcus fermentans]